MSDYQSEIRAGDELVLHTSGGLRHRGIVSRVEGEQAFVRVIKEDGSLGEEVTLAGAVPMSEHSEADKAWAKAVAALPAAEQDYRSERGPGTYHHGYVSGMWTAMEAGPKEVRAFVERRQAEGWTREDPGGGVVPPVVTRPRLGCAKCGARGTLLVDEDDRLWCEDHKAMARTSPAAGRPALEASAADSAACSLCFGEGGAFGPCRECKR